MNVKPHVLDELHAYALGIQTRRERERIEAHIDICVSCRAELMAWDRVVGRLSEAYASEPAPEDLERKILERFSAEGAFGSKKVKMPRGRRGQRRPRRITIGLTAAAVALAFGIGSFRIIGRQGHRNEIAMVAEEGRRVVELRGGSPSSTAFGVVVFGKHKTTGILAVSELPVPGEGTQYQLWMVYKNERIDGGTFSVGEKGSAVHPIRASYPLEYCRAFFVTIENSGGASAPTGPVVLSGTVSL